MLIQKIKEILDKVFNRKEEIKTLNLPEENKKNEFVNYLRNNVDIKLPRVETPICQGDGLGFNNKISC